MKNSGVEVKLHIGEKMGHVDPLYPIPEAERARKEKFLYKDDEFIK